MKGFREIDGRLQGEIAAGATLLKSIVVCLEDARILESVKDMKKRLMQLKNINIDLIKEHEIKIISYHQLNSTLKELNISVQKASRFRGAYSRIQYVLYNSDIFLIIWFLVGKASMATITRCRASIQNGNSKTLISAFRQGY